MAAQDYYARLGVSSTASTADIKKAYKRLAMKYHPDRNSGDASAEKKFKEVQQAYSVLSDEEKRAVYDRYGEAGLKGGAGGPQSDPFGGAGGFFFQEADFFTGGREQLDVEVTLTLSMEELVKGTEKELQFRTLLRCKTCSGKGQAVGSKPTRCRSCQGSGQILMAGIFSISCPHCHGRGSVVSHPCSACSGQGRVEGKQSVRVPIPAGYQEQLFVRGQGAQSSSGKNGDLYIKIRIEPHRFFSIKNGTDLVCQVPISFAMAALGGAVNVPTLYGPYELKIPPETQTHMFFRVSGKGFLNFRTGRYGDLYCRVMVETPVRLNANQKQLIREMDASLKGTPRGKEDASATNAHQPMTLSFFQKVKEFFSGESH